MFAVFVIVNNVTLLDIHVHTLSPILNHFFKDFVYMSISEVGLYSSGIVRSGSRGRGWFRISGSSGLFLLILANTQQRFGGSDDVAGFVSAGKCFSEARIEPAVFLCRNADRWSFQVEAFSSGLEQYWLEENSPKPTAP